MSVPLLPTKVHKPEIPSRNEDTAVSRNKSTDGAASFADAIEKRLNGRTEAGERANRDRNNEPAADPSRGGAAETSTGVPTNQGKSGASEGNQGPDADRHAVPAPGKPDGGYRPLRVLVAEDGKSSPLAASDGDKSELLAHSPSPLEAAAPEMPAAGATGGLGSGLDSAEGDEPSQEARALLTRSTQAGSAPVEPLPDGVPGPSSPELSAPVLGAGTGAGKAVGEEAGRPAVLRAPTEEDAGAARIDLDRSHPIEPGKGLSGPIRQALNETAAPADPSAMLSEHERGPMSAAGEQRADARHEAASTTVRGTQSAGTGGTSATSPALTSPALSQAELPDGLGNQIRWMLNRQSSVAELKLNPAELGSLEVKIALEKETTNIQFLVQNAAAKDMVEDALPRLRALLSDVGVNLQDVNVRQQTAGDHQRHAQSGSAEERDQAYGEGNSKEETSTDFTTPSNSPINGMIDAYA